ncbi:DUF459 domain-containing protein [Thalassoroseus pseudoceratinae]|uniref:DUF459 domain-containing protein n=1 Tax=Thalassoroseus pseudoceratinae TaxID=2713176 RepID=UPI00197F5A9C|nr:Dabb family protein [Thalassoroseus pseudoceratinae]
MLNLRSIFGVVVGMGLLNMTGFAADFPEVGDNERIVFLGDSITQAGAGPNGYVTLVRKAIQKHRPNANIEVIGAGISGNRVPDLQARLKRDVLDRKPTLVVIYIGINDVWHSIRNRGTSQEDFRAGLEDIISQIQDAGAKVILSSPSVIGERVKGENPLKLDKMLDEYRKIGQEVAKKNDVAYLDLRGEFQEKLKEINAEDAEKNVLTTDGVHLNAAGNEFVANVMLNALGVNSDSKSGKLLRHFVLFQFKDESSEEEIQEVVDAFAALPKKIKTIKDFEMGTNISPENKAAGFTHGFLVTFESESDRDGYLPHPAHQDFVKVLRPHLKEVLVFDYWAEK